MDYLEPTFLLYLVVGIAVSFAVFLRLTEERRGEQWFQVMTASLFWPLYLPILLSASEARRQDIPVSGSAPANDEMTTAIAQVGSELEAAMSSLDG